MVNTVLGPFGYPVSAWKLPSPAMSALSKSSCLPGESVARDSTALGQSAVVSATLVLYLVGNSSGCGCRGGGRGGEVGGGGGRRRGRPAAAAAKGGRRFLVFPHRVGATNWVPRFGVGL